MNRKIDKRPPTPTGNDKEDIRQLAEYQNYLREQFNYILSLIYKRLGEEE